MQVLAVQHPCPVLGACALGCSAPSSQGVQETSAFPPTPLLLTRADLGSRWAGAAFPWLGFGG